LFWNSLYGGEFFSSLRATEVSAAAFVVCPALLLLKAVLCIFSF
jgi:hypothetical protein